MVERSGYTFNLKNRDMDADTLKHAETIQINVPNQAIDVTNKEEGIKEAPIFVHSTEVTLDPNR
ncbi:hypothetical protein TSUD_241070 [Trifolium subterraneum]|uniref:Uncharacterized protein n=1 Tax=Trifolium subterraneum TaxID=3900 RepID=A0A2Z6NJN8_TRISU|nr:hypothetical protein TSUD_241070 [Trifolium subterraneum]